MAFRGSEHVEPPPPLLLGYSDLWNGLSSRPFTYSGLVALANAGPAVNAFQTRLTYTREAAVSQTGDDDPQATMPRIEEHLECLTYFQDNMDRLGDTKALGRANYQWVSPSVPAGMLGPYVLHMRRYPQLDECMLVFRWALAAWQAAVVKARAIQMAKGAPPNVDTVAECVALLRRSAGAFQHVAQKGWATATAAGWEPAADRAPEAHPWFAGACAQVVLGQAQYLVAYRSYCKASAFGMAASLYVGAADFFEAAATSFRTAEKDRLKPPTDRFKRLIALYSTLCTARARCALVRQLMTEGEAGRASRLATHARNELALCSYIAEGEAEWLKVFETLSEEVEAMWHQCENDRRNVYMQSLPTGPPAELPVGRALVAATPYAVPRKDLNIDMEC